MNENIPDIYQLIQEISWYFGNQGFNGKCCGDLSLVEFMAVKKVHEQEQITIQEIGNSLNITKSGASKIVDRLEDKGYVLRRQSAVDGRICCVAITEKGTEVIAKIVGRYTDYVGELIKDFDPQAVANVKNVLEMLMIAVRKQGFIKSRQP